jgi:hypothetical protein
MIEPSDPRHGTTKGFHAGCREQCCKRALARDEKARRLDRLRGGRAVPAIGAQRRLQALMRLGWSSHRIAKEAGLPHRNHVWRIINGQKGRPTGWIRRDTDAWVREVYDRLSMKIPTGHYVNRTRAYAERAGWAPPLAWDEGAIDDPDARPHTGSNKATIDYDEAKVVRRVNGERTSKLTPAEAAEVERRLRKAGYSTKEIEETYAIKPERYHRRTA